MDSRQCLGFFKYDTRCLREIPIPCTDNKLADSWHVPPGEQIYGYKAPPPIGWNISTERQQLISSLMTLGAFISSGTAGLAAAKIGRKACLWLACLLCAISTIIMMTTEAIEALYVGRLLIGLANGYFMTFAQLYIQESSPVKFRALFLTVFQFCTTIVSR